MFFATLFWILVNDCSAYFWATKWPDVWSCFQSCYISFFFLAAASVLSKTASSLSFGTHWSYVVFCRGRVDNESDGLLIYYTLAAACITMTVTFMASNSFPHLHSEPFNPSKFSVKTFTYASWLYCLFFKHVNVCQTLEFFEMKR